MPKYRIVFHKKAEKSLSLLEDRTRNRLLADIACLATFSEQRGPLDIAKLEDQENLYRLRTGKLRTVFAVFKQSTTIIILKIEPRERAYE